MYRKLLLGALLALSQITIAQIKPDAATKVTADTVKMASSKQWIKPFDQVITAKSISQKGLFNVHKMEDKYFFEIPDLLLKREILVVTRYSKTPGNSGIYGGELINEQTVYFEKGVDKKIFMRLSIQVNRSTDSTQAIYQAIKNSNLDPIVTAFDIKALSKDGKGTIIDVTELFKGENQVVSINPSAKKKAKLATLAADRSYISKISTYPINIEVKTVKTYTATPSAGFSSRSASASEDAGAITLELNTSFLLLPEVPMQKRYKDERVGYFADEFTLYNDNSQRAKYPSFIVRWRLEPKAEDIAKFKRGELVEPQKPICYYIDPATPEKWRKYLIAGVNDWQKAFEAAGFKNAIMAKEWPVNDTTMSMEDARYSVIRYFASATPNAYGPNVHDPRSGEILESHVGWYHNVMLLIHDMYMVQAGPLDPRARKMQFSDELMGELIRFVSSHEIGHTLGLRHNMGSSSQTPVEKLRDKAWVEANGHTASIMDYARFNYVAQPEDKISPKGLFPRIGDYDKWAIEWGYKPLLSEKNAEDEQKKLFKTTTIRLQNNPRLWFGGEGNADDPRSSTEDLGDNSMIASNYGIKNLKRVMAALPEWTKEENQMYNSYAEMYLAVLTQYNRYMGHVMKNISGMYYNNKSADEPGAVFSPVPKERQKEAIDYMDKQVFQTPEWLLNNEVITKLGLRPLATIQTIQMAGVKGILNTNVLTKLIETSNISADSYPVDEYIGDIHKIIWTELRGNKAIDVYRRSLQKLYVERLGNLINPDVFKTNFGAQVGIVTIAEPATTFSDVQSLVKEELLILKAEVDKAIQTHTDKMTILHLKDISERIDKAFNDLPKIKQR